MGTRQVVLDFVDLGPLPDSSASEDKIALREGQLERIKPPVTEDEAKLLLRCFGPDDCYGLAWTLLHLIESAPSGVPLDRPPLDTDNEWLRRLWARSHR
jgi:hypothetical protein